MRSFLSATPEPSLHFVTQQPRSLGRHAALALLAVALVAAQGCKKEEAAAPPPAPGGAPKPGAAAPAAGAAAGAAAAAAKTGTNAPAAAAGANDTVDLRLNWPVGKRFLQRMDIAFESETTMAGLPQGARQETVQSMDYTVSVLKDREGGGRELELEIVAQKTDAKVAAKQSVAFDSKSDPKTDRANAPAGALRKLVGLKIHYLTDTNGLIEKVVGAQELQSKLIATATPQTKIILTTLLSEENLKRAVNLAIGLPDKPVKVSETWSAQRDNNLGPLGIMQMDLKSTFKGWEEHDKRRCALIEYSGPVTAKPGTAAPPMTVTVENGKVTGKIWFDPVSGMIADASLEQEGTTKIVVSGQTAESKSKTKTSVKVVEVGDVPKAN